MFGSEMLDVALGLVFTYLLLSLICTAANELVAGFLNLRGKKLFAGIENLLYGSGHLEQAPDRTRDLGVTDLYDHPLIRSLYHERWPSYIPSSDFALAVIDCLLPAHVAAERTVERVRAEVLKLRNDNLRQTLLLLIANSNGSMEQLQKSIEEWFDQAMDRVSGWYKRQAQWITLALGVLIAAFANADTVAIANRLSTDAALRQAIIAQAQVFAQRRLEPAAIAHPDTAVRDTVAASDSSLQLLATRVGTKIADLERLGLPLGWQSGSLRSQLNAAKVFGLLLTALALSLGAPFWFDVLSKIIAVRASGQAPDQHPKQR
ncbi:MAG TPA: hypothetical protein VIV88_00610 [Gemmatimonadales bacterium]|jgi:hypothetical protein